MPHPAWVYPKILVLTPIARCSADEAPFAGLRYGLEPLMETYGVDAYFTGHIHMYERSFPVMKGKVEKSYRNPKGVVHVNTGNSGGRNGFENGPAAAYTAFRLTDVPCYTRVTLANATHMSVEQARADNGSVVDSFQLSKQR